MPSRFAVDSLGGRLAIHLQHISPGLEGLRPIERFGLRELEEVRLILQGGSVVDWRRLSFRTYDEVDDYLRLCLFRPDQPNDEARIREILDEAVEYLRTVFRYRVTSVVANPARVHDLFLIASGVGENARWRRIACIVLKVMHTIFHTDSREMLFRTPISSEEFAGMVDQRVRQVMERLEGPESPVISFSGSVKSRQSMITKLLAKRESVAAQIFDKVRYRIVTRSDRDILPMLNFLTSNLFPFNFAVPAQTQNNLVSLSRVLDSTPELRVHAERMQSHLEDGYAYGTTINEYSGEGYRILNFVADVPVRLDEHLCSLDGNRRLPIRPEIAFAPVEFQIVDQRTAEQNEVGDNSHERYKQRQATRVLRRLSRGLVVPKRHGEKPRSAE